MKKRLLSINLRILIILVPLIIISSIMYVRILKLQESSKKGTQLVINEVVADNLSTLKDENGIYSDWIEIYNPTESAIELKGYYLSDSKNELSKWAFPDVTIDGDGYVIVFCDASTENHISTDSYFMHANFSINATSETIYLSDENENIIDSMRLRDQKCDISYGRLYGNLDETGFLPYSTPLKPNSLQFRQNDAVEADWGEVHFSLDGGLYDSNVSLELSCDIEGAAILYTLDGSEPNINSYVYTKPIEITDEGRPNQYTTKKCVLRPSANADNADTQYGVNEVYKSTVVRARILKDAQLSDSIQTNTYFINSDYSMPVVSLTTDPDGLFDDAEGAYVLGYSYYTLRKYGGNIRRTNSSIPTDLAGHIEIYDIDGSVFEDDITMSVAGASSALKNIQKSFHVTLNNKKIAGDMFGTSNELMYERFTLRGPGSGVIEENTYIYPSAFVSNYISSEGIGGQKSRFCILFIDGEYWGIYSLSEPKGKEYMQQYANVLKKDITMVMPWNGVTDKSFDKLFGEIKSRDFTQEDSYKWLKTQVDIDNFMAAVLAEAFFGNTDGISNGDHNLYIWKVKGGLWKWQIFDFDCTLVDNENYIKEMIDFDFAGNESEEKKNFTSYLFQRLWECKTFRDEFTTYVREQCNELYSSENVTAAFERHISSFETEMPENLRRCEKDYTRLKKLSFWVRGIDAEYQNYTMDDWKITVNDMRRFLKNRTQRVLEFFDEL